MDKNELEIVPKWVEAKNYEFIEDLIKKYESKNKNVEHNIIEKKKGKNEILLKIAIDSEHNKNASNVIEVFGKIGDTIHIFDSCIGAFYKGYCWHLGLIGKLLEEDLSPSEKNDFKNTSFKLYALSGLKGEYEIESILDLYDDFINKNIKRIKKIEEKISYVEFDNEKKESGVKLLGIPKSAFEDVMFKIENDIICMEMLKNFQNNCFLFYGPPGTAKSVTLKSILEELGKKGIPNEIITLNVNEIDSFSRILIGEETIIDKEIKFKPGILFDLIFRALEQRKQNNNNGITKIVIAVNEFNRSMAMSDIDKIIREIGDKMEITFTTKGTLDEKILAILDKENMVSDGNTYKINFSKLNILPLFLFTANIGENFNTSQIESTLIRRMTCYRFEPIEFQKLLDITIENNKGIFEQFSKNIGNKNKKTVIDIYRNITDALNTLLTNYANNNNCIDEFKESGLLPIGVIKTVLDNFRGILTKDEHMINNNIINTLKNYLPPSKKNIYFDDNTTKEILDLLNEIVNQYIE